MRGGHRMRLHRVARRDAGFERPHGTGLCGRCLRSPGDEPAKLPRRQFPAIRRGQTSGPNSPSSMAPALFDASPADLTGNRQLAEVRPRHFNLAAHRFR
ncbi:hypothetical protein C6T52_08105 [Burkholderia multivorans]|nr:hypothetical protein C6T52_08105 [Burkholderia multivorans]